LVIETRQQVGTAARAIQQRLTVVDRTELLRTRITGDLSREGPEAASLATGQQQRPRGRRDGAHGAPPKLGVVIRGTESAIAVPAGTSQATGSSSITGSSSGKASSQIGWEKATATQRGASVAPLPVESTVTENASSTSRPSRPSTPSPGTGCATTLSGPT